MSYHKKMGYNMTNIDHVSPIPTPLVEVGFGANACCPVVALLWSCCHFQIIQPQLTAGCTLHAATIMQKLPGSVKLTCPENLCHIRRRL